MHRVTGTFELELFQGHTQKATSHERLLRFHMESLPYMGSPVEDEDELNKANPLKP